LQLVSPLEHTRFKADNFSCQTLLSGEALVVELYCFEPGQSLPEHRHDGTEHVLTALLGAGQVQIGTQYVALRAADTILVPAGLYHGIENTGKVRLVVQQVSSPKPWDARFMGPCPSRIEPLPRPLPLESESP
jgi:quercetin dioxygenase-like cupin family protein